MYPQKSPIYPQNTALWICKRVMYICPTTRLSTDGSHFGDVLAFEWGCFGFWEFLTCKNVCWNPTKNPETLCIAEYHTIVNFWFLVARQIFCDAFKYLKSQNSFQLSFNSLTSQNFCQLSFNSFKSQNLFQFFQKLESLTLQIFWPLNWENQFVFLK